MSTTLKIENFGSLNVLDKLILNADVAVGATSLIVTNSEGPIANDFLIIGTLGSEGSEKVQVSSVPDRTHVNVTATVAAHKQYESAWLLFGDQVKVYRAANTNGIVPADSSFAYLDTATIDIDEGATSYLDPIGGSDYWYKFTYYNSSSHSETTLASAVARRGGGYAGYCSIEDIRTEAGFKNAKYITDAMIDAKRQAAQSQIDSALGGFYTVPFTNPINPFIADITRRLAAGLLLLQQYGAFGTLNSQNGQSKVDKALADIKWLQSGQGTLKDATGASMADTSVSGFSGWPNDTTADTVNGTGDSKFTIDDRY